MDGSTDDEHRSEIRVSFAAGRRTTRHMSVENNERTDSIEIHTHARAHTVEET